MIRVYLDQKDYIRIARGLSGDSNFDDDIKVFWYLLDKINSGLVQIYYSREHLMESMKYTLETGEYFDNYIRAITLLTNGNCIISHDILGKREIELYVAKKYGFYTKLSKSKYPYGKHSQAFFADMDCYELEEFFEDEPLSKRKKRNLRYRLLGMTKKEIDQIDPLFRYFSKEEIIKLLTGSITDYSRVKLLKRNLDQLFCIKNFAGEFRKKTGMINCIKYLDGVATRHVESTIMKRFSDNKLGRPPYTEDKLIAYCIKKYFEDNDSIFSKHLEKLNKKWKFPKNEVIEDLINSSAQEILSFSSYSIILIEYFKRHHGQGEKVRLPSKNDFSDINHMKYLPYVDAYVCDKFFYEVGKNLSKKYNCYICKNLKELQEVIDTHSENQ